VKRTKNKKNKTTTIIASILTSIFAFSLIAFPAANAHTPPMDIPTYAYIQAYPNPIGVNQVIDIFAWLDKFPPTANGEYGDRWQNLTITVTGPDGNTETFGPYTSDPVGTIFSTYTPTQIGTYTFQFNFPGQIITGQPANPAGVVYGGQYIGDYFMPSTSEKVEVTVQEQPIASAPSVPLPTGYWTRPISQTNENWNKIAGNWLGTSNINQYTTAPLSSHIVWTKPITWGGVADGSFGTAGYYTGMSYESYWSPPIIIDGQLYYNVATPPIYGFIDVDLRTGQQVWYQNGTGPQQLGFGFLKQNYPQLSFGQLLNYESPNQHGIIPYLWSTYMDEQGKNDWAMYDPFTGNWILTIVGVPGGGAMFGASNRITAPDGSILIYNADLQNHYLTSWNSTLCIQDTFPSNNSFLAANGYWMWRPPLGGMVDASSGYQANVTLPSDLPMTASLAGIDLVNQIMLYSTGMAVLGMGSFPTPTNFTQFAISINPDSFGEVLWTKTHPWPDGNVTLSVSAVGDGVYAMYAKETRQWYVYSLTSGSKLWGPSESETPLHMYGVSAAIYNGNLYSGDSIGEGGTIYCYNAQTGDLKWTYESPSMGNTGYWPTIPVSVGAIAGDILYVYGSEHSPGPQLEPGFQIGAINATNGEELWNITFWSGGGMGGGMAIADGYMVALNSYDNQIYCFGKGQTATTVSAPEATQPLGTPVMIRGTVTDQSPGAKQDGLLARFPNGVPVVADENMREWMEFLYMQAECPADAAGVEVVLTTLDPNGNTYEIGRTTTSLSGAYGCAFDPPVPGLYKIIATFEGSNGYYGSYAETYVNVEEAPTTAQPIEPEPTTQPTEATSTASELVAPEPTAAAPTVPEPTASSEAPFITTEIAILVAVAVAVVIGIVSYWTLRKHK
jgi:hypothetical protein